MTARRSKGAARRGTKSSNARRARARQKATASGHSFPGRVVQLGDADRAVLAVQRRLNQLGCGPVDEDGVFGPQTIEAVKLFQARFADLDGEPHKVDGMVGAVTWGSLFGRPAVAALVHAGSPLLRTALEIAASQVGKMEVPPGSNRGPDVDRYLVAVGLDPSKDSYAWCAAFLYWCFREAAKKTGVKNPIARTPGVLDHWTKAGEAGAARITAAKAHMHEDLVRPGHIFVMDTGGGTGHSGLIEEVSAGKLVTIEGNTNDAGDRNGIGVFRRTRRRIRDINVGFIDYGSA